MGEVILIGAGPGSADLLTVRGLRALRRADVIVADYLVPKTFLADLGVSAEEVEWLEPGPSRKSQAEINARLAEAAQTGRTVVRLKCGDPLVFGRGAEEAAFLEAAGVSFEIVPGVSAYAGAGLPLTRRGAGRSFAAATARQAGGGVADELPRADSVVLFMAVSELEAVVERLRLDGWDAGTPAALVERAARAWERRVHGSLAEIVRLAREAEIAAPALLVVGAAADEAALPPRPRVLYTGLDPSNFRTLGEVIHWPALRVVDDPAGWAAAPAALDGLEHGEYDAVVFTSRVGVRSFFAVLDERGLDARALAGTQVVTAGTGTDGELRERGIRADETPDELGGAGILSRVADGAAVLLVQGTHAPKSLTTELARRGCRVTRLALHRVVPNPELGRPLPEHDVVYFASPSGVRAFAEAYGAAGFECEPWCVGDVTLAQVERLGFSGKVVNPYVPANADAAVAAV